MTVIRHSCCSANSAWTVFAMSCFCLALSARGFNSLYSVCFCHARHIEYETIDEMRNGHTPSDEREMQIFRGLSCTITLNGNMARHSLQPQPVLILMRCNQNGRNKTRNTLKKNPRQYMTHLVEKEIVKEKSVCIPCLGLGANQQNEFQRIAVRTKDQR